MCSHCVKAQTWYIPSFGSLLTMANVQHQEPNARQVNSGDCRVQQHAQLRKPDVVLAGEGDEIDVDLDMDPANAEQNAPAEAKRKAKVRHMCSCATVRN